MKILLILSTLLLTALIRAGDLPGWGGSPVGGACRSCGGGTGSVGGIDVGTLFRADLGQGTLKSQLGALVLRSTEASDLLGDPLGLEFEADNVTEETEIIYDSSNRFAQFVTPRVFIDISINNAYKYTLRIMKVAAKGTMSSGRYAVDSNSTYLIKEFTIENPDTTSANNRVKIRNTGTSDEWMFTYNTGISGWTITLPAGLGSLDLISTNHASTAWTTIKRYKNPAGTTIAQQSQVFTNLSWVWKRSKAWAVMFAPIAGATTPAGWRLLPPVPIRPFTRRNRRMDPGGWWRAMIRPGG